MKEVYKNCTIGFNNDEELEGDIVDKVAWKTIGAIMAKLPEKHQTYEVVKTILETAIEQLEGVRLQWDE